MKTSLLYSAMIGSVLLALTLASRPVLAQEAPPTPGPEHELLKKMEGTWTAKIKMGDDPAGSDGSVTYKMECGGLWLISNFRGDFGGMTFEGRGMDGYDPKKKKYVSVWVDSMSTQPMFSEGTYDKEKKTLTMTGEAPGPDGTPAKFKMVSKMVDDDHQTFTMYMVAEGQENKMMTIDYTRKK